MFHVKRCRQNRVFCIWQPSAPHSSRAVQELFEFLKMPAPTMVQIFSEVRRKEKNILLVISGIYHGILPFLSEDGDAEIPSQYF